LADKKAGLKQLHVDKEWLSNMAYFSTPVLLKRFCSEWLYFVVSKIVLLGVFTTFPNPQHNSSVADFW
jgi:hypothetical protein